MIVRSESGFSIVEALIAIVVFTAAIGPLLLVAAAGQRLARSQPEAADLHQRLRVAADRLKRDLALAGAGPVHGPSGGAVSSHIAVIVPARTGLRLRDPELSAFADRVSVFYVPEDGARASLAMNMADPQAALRLNTSLSGCSTSGICGFTDGTHALILDPTAVGAGYDIFTVTGTVATTGELTHDAPNLPFSRSYDAGSTIQSIVQRVYHFDRANSRLMLYDGYQSDLPLVDHVVDVKFEYFGGPGLSPLTLDRLTDGPVCGISPNRFDEDLLRIRMVRVSMRLQAAADDVRGRGSLFARPGRSTSGYSSVADYEITFDVTPRNLVPTVGE